MTKARNIMILKKRRRAKKRASAHAEWDECPPGWSAISLFMITIFALVVVSLSNEPKEMMMHSDRVSMLAERDDGIAGASPMSGMVFR